MIHLGLDTSLGACSAALYDSTAQRVLAADMQFMERGHAESLGPMVQRVFAQAGLKPKDIGRVIVTRGPGTFTGLRIGLAFAKGLALALNIPLLGIDSLWATAAPQFGTSKNIIVSHRAGATRKFYVGCFAGPSGSILHKDALLSADALQRLITELDQPLLIGSGLTEQPNTWPDARLFVQQAASLPDDPLSGVPFYLREPDAKPMALQGKTAPSLRLARVADSDVLSGLHSRCFETAWTADMFRVSCASASATILIAESRGEACGFIQAQTAVDEAEVMTLCVLPVLRRHGLAMLLVGGLLADLKVRGIKKLFLEVADGNAAALGLYRRVGFLEIGRRKGYYAKPDGQSEDAITMALVLKE
jgi:tRNA threonylcarbamoyl adenosine modification protein YeaZ/ribosomal-protein-alanine acetyltransferase